MPRRRDIPFLALLRQALGRALLSLVLSLVLWLGVIPAQAFDSDAPYAYLYDVSTSTVLFSKNAEASLAPGSMTKLLTMAVVFDMVRNGKLSLDQDFKITVDAWRRGGAPSGGRTMFAEVNSLVRVEDLIRGAIIMAANDACIALAQGIDGSEDAFAARMNAYARNIGMTGTHVTNATGLPDPGHYATAQDLSVLALHIIETYPEFYPLFSESEFTWNSILQRNRNPLLKEAPGGDGLATGDVEESGYGLVGSVIREGRRVVLMVGGLGTEDARIKGAQHLLDHAYGDFRLVEIAGEGVAVARAKVYGGVEQSVGLIGGAKALNVLIPREGRERIRARIEYVGPLRAPVEKGAQVASLIIERDGLTIQETPLYTRNGVAVGPLKRQAWDGLVELLTGWFHRLDLMRMIEGALDG